MKNLVLRTVTGILFVAAVVASILLYEKTIIPFAVLMSLVAVEGTREFLKMTGVSANRLVSVLAMLMVIPIVVFPALVHFPDPVFLILILLLFFPVLSAVLLFQKNDGVSSLRMLSFCLVPVFWIALPVMLMFAMAEELAPLLLALFITIWLNDTLAYCAGSLFGRHKLCERISPKKTWEGFIIALVLTVAASVSFGYGANILPA